MKKNKKLGYEIVYQDDAIVAVNKASGLAVVSGRGRVDCLVGLLGEDARLGGKKPMIVHRIDADTSGLVVLALNAEAHRGMSEQFRLRTVTKEYLALVRGTPLHESGSVDLPIGRDGKDKNRMVIRGMDAKPSRTKWVVEQRFAGVTLMKVYPVTGRRHQIRVHLKAMGYPLAVDKYYGGEKLLLSEFKRHYKVGKMQEEKPMMERLTLHARGLEFLHPMTGAAMKLEAELPKDFRSAVTALERWANRS